MPGLVQQPQHHQHHHRSTTKVSHKPYKSRFASKNALKDVAKGKIEKGVRRTPHQHVMSKFDRKNRARQQRLNKGREHAEATNVFAGRDGAPRNVVLVALCDDVDAATAVRSLNGSLDIEEDVPAQGRLHAHIDRFKQKILYTTVQRELWSTLSACQTADYVLLVLSAKSEVDGLGELLLRSIESQGISNVYTAVQGLDGIDPPKHRPGIVSSLRSFITHFFPDQEKVFSLDSRQECQNVLRSLCTTTPKGIRWRQERSWMSVEDVNFPLTSSSPETPDLVDAVLTGVVRGRNLKADRLITVGDWGDFQISSITAAPLESNRKAKGNAMTVDTEGTNSTLDQPSQDADTLDELAPEEAVMQDVADMDNRTTAPSMATTTRRGVLLDDAHYFHGDDGNLDGSQGPTTSRRLPRGTSKYQAAWYLGDVSDSGSDLESVLSEEDIGGDGVGASDTGMVDVSAGPADGVEGLIPPTDPSEMALSEYAATEAPFDDRELEEESGDIEAYRRRRRQAASDDLQFPDEIELPPSVLARERLAKYRGLKSLRTSPWDTHEDRAHQPDEWDRLLDVADYKGARSKVLRETLVGGGVKAGTRVHVRIRGVARSMADSHDASRPLGMFSLLRHEHKRTALNFGFTLGSEAAEPLKAKEELLVQCGPRRFAARPVFSQDGSTPNDVHKFERFLRPGKTTVASFVGPLTWGSVPALFFKRNAATKEEGEDVSMENENNGGDKTRGLAGGMSLIGHGTAMPPSTARVVAKRAVLTGEPYKINRRLVTVRYMFFDAGDVAWFKALPLWTNRGRQGAIKDSLGTHGYFKATFDGRIGMQDAVGVSLYKRVWPRPARRLTPGDLL